MTNKHMKRFFQVASEPFVFREEKENGETVKYVECYRAIDIDRYIQRVAEHEERVTMHVSSMLARIRAIENKAFGYWSDLEKIPEPHVLSRRVDSLEGLSVRLDKALYYQGIEYVGDLVQKTEAEMLRIPNLGKRSLAELHELLRGLGLSLGMSVSWWVRPEDAS